MMFRALVFAAATVASCAPTLNTNPVTAAAQQYLEAQRQHCPQAPALGEPTSLQEIHGGSMYELTFNSTRAFHVVYQQGRITKCVPSICDRSRRKRPAVTTAQVDEINRKGLSWKAGLSPDQFGKTIEEFGMGYAQQTTTTDLTLDQTPPEPTPPTRRAATDLPVAYDARDADPGQIQCKAFTVGNQGGCGNCYAFAAAASFSARMCRAANSSIGNIIASPQQAMDCTIANGCTVGSTAFAVYGAFANNGVTENWCDPFTQTAGTCNSSCSTGVKYFAQPGTVQTVGGPGVVGN